MPPARRVPPPAADGSSWRWAVAAALVVAAGAVALALPGTLSHPFLSSPDELEHLAIAWSLATGRGLVNPVNWNYLLTEAAPIPGWAMRAPLVSLLAAVPLALGASLMTLFVLHVVWSSLVGGAVVLVGRRLMSLPAAIGAAVLVAWSAAWTRISQIPWTEVTAVATLLLVVVTAGGVVRSVPAALACAAATYVAWLSRPNAVAVSAAVLVAAAWEIGLRRALSSRPLWTYAASVAVLIGTTNTIVEAVTGAAPYAGYSMMAQVFSGAEAWQFQKIWVGGPAFVQAHSAQVMARIALHTRGLFHELFIAPRYLWVGWLAVLGLVDAATRRDAGAARLERRVLALAGLGFAVLVCLTYTGFDNRRYPVLPAACFAILGAGALDRIGARLLGRVGHWLPLAVALTLAARGTMPSLPVARNALAEFRQYGSRPLFRGPGDPALRAFCPSIDDRDAVVAAFDPWALNLFCGSAALHTPSDLTTPALVDRWLDERKPVYVVTDGTPQLAVLESSPRLEPLARHGRFRLFRVAGAPVLHPWSAPPPMADLLPRRPAPPKLDPPATFWPASVTLSTGSAISHQ